jgi:hypothetical protein
MLYLRLIILSVGDDIFIDSGTLLVIDFMNLKIKSAQCFICVYSGRVCVRMLIKMSVHMYINIYICTVFLSKKHDDDEQQTMMWQHTPCLASRRSHWLRVARLNSC